MTELQLLVKSFQENNDNTIINKIFDLVEIDYLKHPGRKVETIYLSDDNYNDYELDVHNCNYTTNIGSIKKFTYDFPEPLMYVAYRLRAFREKIARQHLSLRNENKPLYKVFDEISFQICHEFDIEEETRLCDLIEKINNIDKDEFEKYLIWHEEYPEIYQEIMEHENYIETIKNETRKRLNEEFEPALRYAVSKVDFNRSDKEIVSYINRCFLTSWINYQLKRDGNKRLQRCRGHRSIIVKPEWSDPARMIFGTENFSMELLEKLLLPKQFELIKNIIAIIENDIEKNLIANYKLNNDGKTILNKRYIANQLGLTEDNLKHKLSRIRKRITKKNLEYLINSVITNPYTIKALKTSKESILLEQEREQRNNFEMMNYLYEKKHGIRYSGVI